VAGGFLSSISFVNPGWEAASSGGQQESTMGLRDSKCKQKVVVSRFFHACFSLFPDVEASNLDSSNVSPI
jgi:hypothetical protein